MVLAVLVAVGIALFVTGAVGAARADPEPEWPDPFGSFTPADGLRAEELSVTSGACSVGETIDFAGGCALAVAPVEGGWPWQRVTRTVRLVGVLGTVRMGLTVQGKALRTDLDPGDDVRLTFTRDGGDLVLACLAIGGCTVALAEDGPE